MSVIRIKTANAIIFQLLRKNLAGDTVERRQWQEVSVIPMAVLPASLRYEYGGRSAISQTIPDSVFVDRYGMQMTRVLISGTFGLQPRRIGATIKDGYTRLLDFRDELFKLSHQSRPIKNDGQATYVYAVNYYDFIYDEQFCVDLTNFLPEVDARRNAFEPTYQLSFQRLGPLIQIQTEDILLKLLLDVDAALKLGEQALDDAVTFLGQQPALKTIAGISSYLLNGLDILDTLLPELTDLSIMYTNAIIGQTQSFGELSSNPSRSFITAIKNG